MWWFLKKIVDTDTEIVYSYGRETKEQTGNLKYDKINVINITAMVSKVERGIFTPIPITQSTKGSEKLSAAKALPKNPDNVIAT